MTSITNPKLSSVEPPAWSAYPGVSVLYDPPGCAELSGVQPLEAVSPRKHLDLMLYDRLSEAADHIADTTAQDGEPLCALPRATYHVTLCDGINEGMRDRVHGQEARREIEQTLAGLPDSLLWATSVMRLLRDRDLLWTVWTHPISFRLSALKVWGHVLVARLEPADEGSTAALAAHEASRGELVRRLSVRLGVQVQTWRPHVTLGYFANETAAARTREHVLPQWHGYVRERTRGLSLTFRSASVYGFTDMVSFWRLGH